MLAAVALIVPAAAETPASVPTAIIYLPTVTIITDSVGSITLLTGSAMVAYLRIMSYKSRIST